MEIDKIQSFIYSGPKETYRESESQIKEVVVFETPRAKIRNDVNRELGISQPPPRVDMRPISEIEDISIDQINSLTDLDSIGVPEPGDLVIGQRPLNQAEIIIYGVIFEEAIESFDLLGAIYPVGNLRTTIRYLPISERFSSVSKATSERALEAEIYKLGSETESTYYRLQETRLRIQFMFEEALKDILINSAFHSLMRRISDYVQLKKDEDGLLRELAYNRRVIPKLQEFLKREEKNFKVDIQKLSEYTGQIKDKLDDEMYLKVIKENYVTKWENSRQEQNTLRNYLLEKNEKDIIEKYADLTSKENRVHSEIMQYLYTNIHDMEEETLEWQKRYEEEIEKRDTDIQILCSQRDNLIEEMEELQTKYELHAALIAEVREIKNERLKLEKEQVRRLHAAIKIQCWWRGLMVRKHLGPFRKMKKGKKGKKGEKGKKKTPTNKLNKKK